MNSAVTLLASIGDLPGDLVRDIESAFSGLQASVKAAVGGALGFAVVYFLFVADDDDEEAH